MIAVGCDFGLRKSGVVLLRPDGEIESQNLIRTHLTSKGPQRLVEIEKALDSILLPYKGIVPVEIFVEGYAYGAKYQRESLAELGGVMRRYFYLNSIDYWVIPPTELKFFVTGTGKASKNYMKKCTKDLWGHSFKSDDVCDAHGIAQLGTNVLKAIQGVQGIAHLPEHQQSVVKNIITHPEYYKNSNTARKKPRKKK